jgi:hypothetical protein
VGYVPSNAVCELKTSVTAEKSDSRSWFSSGPVITGCVTLLNPKEYGIPVSSVQVTAKSSDGQLYTAYADCGNGSPSTFVPTNPVPYTYGQVSWRLQGASQPSLTADDVHSRALLGFTAASQRVGCYVRACMPAAAALLRLTLGVCAT